jgi:hypothetical protein
MSTRKLFLTLAAIAALLLPFSTLSAQAPVREPDYLHALSNLRQAWAFLDASKRPNYKHERKEALKAVERSIDLVSSAAHSDGESTHYPPAPQMQGNIDAPWRSALKLLGDARHDVTQGVDRPEHIGKQEKVLREIDKARRIVSSTLTIADPR